MTERESTHLIIDGENLLVSPNIMNITTFLQSVEKEVESSLSVEEKMKDAKAICKQMLDLVKFLLKKLNENGIDHEYGGTLDSSKLEDTFHIYPIFRPNMIVVFSYLEVLFSLNISYTEKTNDKKTIVGSARNPEKIRAFLTKYCLAEENPWCKRNQKRASKITAEKIRNLRNSLVHFFSLAHEIFIVPSDLVSKGEEIEKILEKKGKKNATFITPEDLFEITKGAAALMLKEWDKGFRTNPQDFKERILCVQSIVNENAAQIFPVGNFEWNTS